MKENGKNNKKQLEKNTGVSPEKSEEANSS